nr:probable aspartyl protease At4g16563 [Tanacetum cinerariifolium]
MSFSLGASQLPVTLYMDTHSDLVWVPCKPFTCIMCEGKSDPQTTPLPFDIRVNSSSDSPVTCQSRACSFVHNHVPCAMSRCPLDSIEMSECQNYTCPSFYYAYGDGIFVGKLYEEVLELPMSTPPSLTVENITFSCAHEALAEPVGVAGFGRGALRLPTQLSAYSPNLGSQFSYCLISHSFDSHRVSQPSPLILGRRVDPPLKVNKVKQVSQPQPFAYTHMLENTKHPYYYYVGLEAVTVGKNRITAPLNMLTIDENGNGGMVVDSGMTYSMLPEDLYNSVMGEFGRQVKSGYKRAQQVEDKTGLY